MSPQRAHDITAFTDFIQHVMSQSRLNDPRIVHVYQAGGEGARRWFAMELVEGQSLEERLGAPPPMSEREARRIGAEIARALEAAQRCGIVHRDVKPGNVFLRPDGAVKIGDFGLARSPSLESTKLTDVGALACTPAYASPEQLDGEETDFRADIYSLGAVLYEMAAQRPPFLVERLVPGGRPPSLRSLRPEYSLAYEDVVTRCLAEKPEARWQSYAELIAALDRDPARAGVTSIPVPSAVGPAAPLSRAWRRTGAVGLAVLAGILFALLTESGRVAEPVAVPPPLPVALVERLAAPVPPPPPPAPVEEAVLARPLPSFPSESDLAVLRRTLPDRRRYRFESSLAALGPGAERERIERAAAAFAGGLPLQKGDRVTIVLRDGRTLAGRIEGREGDGVLVDRERVEIAAIAPVSFNAGRDPLVRAGCGDAAGVLAEIARIDPRHEIGIVDAAIEEALAAAESGDFAGLKALRLSRALRASVEPALGARVKRVDDERHAAELRDRGDFAKLLLEKERTFAGLRAASELLVRWRSSLPPDPDFELVGEVPWGTWRPDAAHAPGGEARWDAASRAYLLSVRRPADRLWLVKPFEGARRGWQLRFRGRPDTDVRFAAALSFTRWVEVGRTETLLLHANGEGEVSAVRRVNRSGSLLTAVPQDGVTLIYVDDALAFALPAVDWSLEAGLQVGVGGGTAIVESIRVQDRTR